MSEPEARVGRVPPWLSSLAAPAAQLVVIVAFAAVTILAPVWRGDASFLVFPDAEDQTYPWMQRIAQAVDDGHLPGWDATTFSGHPLAGELQPAPHYPPNLVLAATAADDGHLSARAIDVYIGLHFVLAAAGMCLLGRLWSHGAWASLAAGLVYAFGGVLATRAAAQAAVFFSAAYLPFAVAAVAVRARSGHRRWLVVAGGVVGLQIVAGHVQPALQTALLVGAYVLRAELRGTGPGFARLRRAALGAAVTASGLVVALPTMLQSLPWLAHAYRFVSLDAPLAPGERIPLRDYGRLFILEPRDLQNFFDPFSHPVADSNALYVGVPALVLVAGVVCGWARGARPIGSTRVPWLAAVGVLAFLVMLGHRTPVSWIVWHVPLLADIRQPARWALVAHFCLSALVLVAVDATAGVARADRPGERAWVAAAAGVALILGTAVVAVPRNGWGARQIVLGVLSAAILVAGVGGRRLASNRAAWAPAVACVVVGLGLHAGRALWLPAVDPSSWVEDEYASTPVAEFLAPTFGRYRVQLHHSAGLKANVGMVWRVETEFGYGATVNQQYLDYLQGNWALDSPRLDALNVRYVVAREPLPLVPVFDDPTSDLVVYERPGWMPRAYLASDRGRPGAAIEATGHVEQLHFSDDRRSYAVAAGPEGDVLVLAELVLPGWRAEIDGAPVALGATAAAGVDDVVRSIEVPSGEHVVTLTYDPSLLPFGL